MNLLGCSWLTLSKSSAKGVDWTPFGNAYFITKECGGVPAPPGRGMAGTPVLHCACNWLSFQDRFAKKQSHLQFVSQRGLYIYIFLHMRRQMFIPKADVCYSPTIAVSMRSSGCGTSTSCRYSSTTRSCYFKHCGLGGTRQRLSLPKEWPAESPPFSTSNKSVGSVGL